MIAPDQIVEIVRRIEARGLDQAMLDELRTAYPDVRFTRCLDDEINNVKPVLETAKLNIYLVDSRDHCPRLTGDPEVATGIVLAEVIEDTI